MLLKQNAMAQIQDIHRDYRINNVSRSEDKLGQSSSKVSMWLEKIYANSWHKLQPAEDEQTETAIITSQLEPLPTPAELKQAEHLTFGIKLKGYFKTLTELTKAGDPESKVSYVVDNIERLVEQYPDAARSVDMRKELIDFKVRLNRALRRLITDTRTPATQIEKIQMCYEMLDCSICHLQRVLKVDGREPRTTLDIDTFL